METVPIKKILIVLESDSDAQKVAEAGFSLAKNLDAGILMLHVITNSMYYSPPEDSSGIGLSNMGPWKLLEDEEDIEKSVQEFFDQLKLHFGDKNISTLIRQGHLDKSVLNTAKEFQAEIIVMGSHSHKRFQNILAGDATEKLIHHSEIPLYIVPASQKN